MRVWRVKHATDEATLTAKPAAAHRAVAAACPVAQGRMGAIARVVAGVAGTGVAVVGAIEACRHGFLDRHAVLADIGGADVIVVDGDTGGASPGGGGRTLP